MDIDRPPFARTVASDAWTTGPAWIESVVPPGPSPSTQIDSVTFAPGARTRWHRHDGEQVLVVTAGVGLVQCEGGPVEAIRTGDRVRIKPGEWHWHGAGTTTSMTHLAIEQLPHEGDCAELGEPVELSGEVAPVSRVIVLDQELPDDLAVRRVEVRRITIEPNGVAGAHVHNGPVFGSIETGSVKYQAGDDDEPRILQPGDVFYEPARDRISHFDAQEQGVTFLAYFPLASGQEATLDML
ncbi:cupin domain-containing protein [Kribbella pittospori]|uniref:Cupin domain-containing protein n=1 Tax=Kribbella pittospori TaxID=722689 RepID=A0A4R0K9C2_9ACTN|nr:cupin domain-containing protein [Kribbella pittospori]TCC54548.1 cupin domain-containing protein [Kribbella pittospori]